MRMTTKLLATVATLGALATATFAYAEGQTAPEVKAAQPCAQCPVMDGQKSMEEAMNARFDSMERMLTLTDEQKPAWKAYVESSKAMHGYKNQKFDKPAVDMQERLERRIVRGEAKLEALKKFAQARAELLKVLNPSQKYVLEQREMQHGRMGGHPGMGMGMDPHHGMMHGMNPHHGMMNGQNPHQGMMNGQNPHHGMMMPPQGEEAPKADAKDAKDAAKM